MLYYWHRKLIHESFVFRLNKPQMLGTSFCWWSQMQVYSQYFSSPYNSFWKPYIKHKHLTKPALVLSQYRFSRSLKKTYYFVSYLQRVGTTIFFVCVSKRLINRFIKRGIEFIDNCGHWVNYVYCFFLAT